MISPLPTANPAGLSNSTQGLSPARKPYMQSHSSAFFISPQNPRPRASKLGLYPSGLKILGIFSASQSVPSGVINIGGQPACRNAPWLPPSCRLLLPSDKSRNGDVAGEE